MNDVSNDHGTMHLLQHGSFESQLQKWGRQGAGTDMFGVHFCHRGLELQVGLFHLSLPLLLQLQQVQTRSSHTR